MRKSETDNNSDGRARKMGEGTRERCCHSSVMDEEAQQCELSSFQSNLICSSTSRDNWATEQGGIKHAERPDETLRCVRKVWETWRLERDRKI